jgi:hypothetical protein
VKELEWILVLDDALSQPFAVFLAEWFEVVLCPLNGDPVRWHVSILPGRPTGLPG